jgi:hypothetical protein
MIGLLLRQLNNPNIPWFSFWDYPKEVKFALVLKEPVIHSCPN